MVESPRETRGREKRGGRAREIKTTVHGGNFDRRGEGTEGSVSNTK